MHGRLQWIQEGKKSSKFFLNLLEKKVLVDKVIGDCRSDGSLEENPTKIRAMFSNHSQNISYPYPLKDNVVAARKSCYGVVPNKVSIVNHDILD